MKAIVTTHAGAQNSLVLTDVPVPTIDEKEVLVRIRTIGVGNHDRWFMPENANFPYPIGIEAAGTVEATGSAVTNVKEGDRVMFVSSMQPKGGVWAEFAAVAAGSLIVMPDSLDFVRAAALPVAGGTALRAVQMLAPESGDTAFIAGASGAIGTLLIQLLRARGFRLAASASARNQDYLLSVGVEKAVDYQDPSWEPQVLDWLPGGVDGAVAIQPGTGAGSMRVVREGGTVVTISGDQLPPERGITVAQVMPGPDIRAEMARLATDVASGSIRVEVERVYPFEEGVKALEKTETRHARGKLIVTIE